MDAVARCTARRLREAIVPTWRVGSGAGPDVALIAEIHGASETSRAAGGGGVRTVEDLRALEAAGAAGARRDRPAQRRHRPRELAAAA
jgi:uncharacterized protein related to proFAR isomerase